eukprot:scaffold90882_cov31-Tisochrysis_lutea.AAC.1
MPSHGRTGVGKRGNGSARALRLLRLAPLIHSPPPHDTWGGGSCTDFVTPLHGCCVPLIHVMHSQSSASSRLSLLGTLSALATRESFGQHIQNSTSTFREAGKEGGNH